MTRLASKNLSLKPFTPKEIPRLMAMLAIEPFKGQLFNWQFYKEGSASADAEENTHLIALYNQGQLVAFNGVMPVKAWLRGDERQIYWSCDLIVDGDYRGQGIGHRLKQELKNECPDYIMSLGIADRAMSLLISMDWQLGTRVLEFKKQKLGFGPKSLAKTAVQWLNRISRLFLARRSLDFAVNISDSLPEPGKLDELWRRVRASYDKVIARDSEYLIWKYQQHPLAAQDYRFIILQEQHLLQGVLIVRYCDGCLHIVDYLGPQGLEHFYQLLKAAIKYYPHARNYRVITSSMAFHRALVALGFHKTRVQQRFVAYHPTEKEPADDWFIMAGDSDGELLQAARSAYLNKKRNLNNE